MPHPSVNIGTSHEGINTVSLENRLLETVVLAGKGADIVEFRDKRTNENYLFEAPHEWQSLDGPYVPSIETKTAWMDHYPGGWQDCLPLAGNEPCAHGANYGLHGESSLQAWDYDVVEESSDRVIVTFSCDLVRYPFHVERTLRLERDSPTLSVTERIRNNGAVELPYVWLQHIAFGAPLLSDETILEFPDCRVTVETEPQGESPLTWGETFQWPTSNMGVDMRKVPSPDAGIHDLSYAHDMQEGWYAVTNPRREFGVVVSFDHTLFESVWVWRACGGFQESPFFGREYVLGLEPCTGWPANDIPDSHGPDGTGTLETIEPGATVVTTVDVTSNVGHRTVDESDSEF